MGPKCSIDKLSNAEFESYMFLCAVRLPRSRDPPWMKLMPSAPMQLRADLGLPLRFGGTNMFAEAACIRGLIWTWIISNFWSKKKKARLAIFEGSVMILACPCYLFIHMLMSTVSLSWRLFMFAFMGWWWCEPWGWHLQMSSWKCQGGIQWMILQLSLTLKRWNSWKSSCCFVVFWIKITSWFWRHSSIEKSNLYAEWLEIGSFLLCTTSAASSCSITCYYFSWKCQ